MCSVRCLVSSVLLIALWPLVAAGAEAEWDLVFEDDFERAEIGDGWHLCGERSVAKIVDGRLFLDGGGATILIDRNFKPDVKIEFVAEANPDAPPCDLSAALPGSNAQGYWHLLGFGAGNNQFNHIVGAGAHARDRKPKLLPENGKKYKLVGVKEGKRLAYYVDDQLIIEAKVDDPIGGPSFDQVGLVTWNGMYVDYVKVYERRYAASDGPFVLTSMPDLDFAWENRKLTYTGEDELPAKAAEGIKLYNERKYIEAVDALSSEAEPTIPGVVALSYVMGDLAYECRADDQANLAERVRNVALRNPHHHAMQKFSVATKWFSRITNRSRDRIVCTRLTLVGPEHNPFYYKAKLFMTRFHYASALEGARQKAKQAALAMFGELREMWPDHPGLREFSGEKVPWGEELIRDEADGPAWARHLQEAMARQQAILNWWATVRQSADGQLGGGWGDDVELLRSWVPATCVTSACEPAVAGIERLAQGVWDHVLKEGYDASSGDVEHSAEPSADSLPTMILLRYGDPRWVEYNLRSAKTIRERFMAINDRGFLQFKSTEFGMAGINEHFQGGGDTGYHARAMKHFIWLAWYGIPEAKDIFLKWCDTWHDVTMRQIDTKPSGFPPPSIWYPSGDIFPPNGKPWYDERTNYYGFPGLAGMVFDSFVTAYFLSGDEKYLDPINAMMDLATKGPLARHLPDEAPDHPHNLLASAAHFAGRDVTAPYRWLTGERVYDEYTLRYPSPTQRYRINYDLDQYGKTFERLAGGLRYNWTQFTSEVLQTDRAGLAGASEIMGAFTGALRNVRDAGAPTMGVTWITPDLNFAAMVTENLPRRLRVRLYNFNETPMRVGLRPWRLVPGVYVLNAGEPVPGERSEQSRYTWDDPKEVTHLHRGTPVWLDVPSRKEWVVDLRCRRGIDQPSLLPDLAVHARDVERTDGIVKVAVHNIGGAGAAPFDVVLQVKTDEGWSSHAQVRIQGLQAIKNLEPVIKHVEFKVSVDTSVTPCRVVIDPVNEVPELYELNNTALLAQSNGQTSHASLMESGVKGIADRPRPGINGPHTLCRHIEKELSTRYLVHLPAKYEAGDNRLWPLIVFLHGAGERGNDITKVARWGPLAYARQHPEFPFVVVGPQCPMMKDWSPELVNTLLDEVIGRYDVDTDRIYLTGLSMGGAGTWETAMAYPDRFAAIVPLCGRVIPLLSGALWKMPVWVFHGEQDQVVPFSQSKEIVEILRGMGNEKVKFTAYPEADHHIWKRTYNNPELYDWILRHRRSDRS